MEEGIQPGANLTTTARTPKSARTNPALARCQVCDALATWQFGSADCFGDWCDVCVPRGCSCQRRMTGTGARSFRQYRDEIGRLLPCVEIDFDPNGHSPKLRPPTRPETSPGSRPLSTGEQGTTE